MKHLKLYENYFDDGDFKERIDKLIIFLDKLSDDNVDAKVSAGDVLGYIQGYCDITAEPEDEIEVFEKFSDRIYGKEGLINSRSISKEVKDKILPYVTSNSYYYNKKMHNLRIPKIKGKNFDGVSMGADKNGFFVNTHRARSKSYDSPANIPDGKIKFIESTG